MTEFPQPWIETIEKNKVRKTTLEYEEVSTYDFIMRWAEKIPDKPLAVFATKGGKTITYRQFSDSMKSLAVTLQGQGVKKGDKVAIMLPNTPHYIIGHYAVLALGAIVVQTNPLYTESELSHIIKDSGAVGMISITMYQEKINNVMKEENELKWAVFGHITDYMSGLISFLGKVTGKLKEHPAVIKIPSTVNYKDAIVADRSGFKRTEVDFDDVALFQYTGGTTGVSKGAMLTHRNISCNAQQARDAVHMVPEQIGSVLTILPLFHSFALTACLGLSQQLGIPLILVPNPGLQLPTGEVHAMIEKHKISFSAGVPTIYNTMLNHPAAKTTDWSSLIASISGGAALPMEVARQFKEITGADLVEGYGLSETSPLITINPVGNDAVKPMMGSIGLPAPDTFIKIVDQDDRSKLMPLGEVGEIACKGPQIMKGYWGEKMKHENEAVLFDDGFFLTGDLAYMDEVGFTYIVDRKKDMIIVSGNNVYPLEVENVLFDHPKILEAACAGYHDDVKGERVGVWIVFHPGESMTEEEVLVYCKEKLAPFKVPKRVTFRDELPKTIIGKVLRRKLQETD